MEKAADNFAMNNIAQRIREPEELTARGVINVHNGLRNIDAGARFAEMGRALDQAPVSSQGLEVDATCSRKRDLADQPNVVVDLPDRMIIHKPAGWEVRRSNPSKAELAEGPRLL